MGGRVPAEDMTEERIELIARVKDKFQAKGLALRLVEALETCPRMSCAYCVHQARSEQERSGL